MSKETGGPAFPNASKRYEAQGMTLRDYFAAKAMQSLAPSFHNKEFAMACAEQAYAFADAMLEARK